MFNLFSKSKKEKTFFLDTVINLPSKQTRVKTFKVKANTLEEAQARLEGNFKNKHTKLEFVDSKKKRSAWPCIICFSIVAYISTLTFKSYTDAPWWRIWNRNFDTNVVILMPDLLSIIFAVLLYSAFVLRVKKWGRIFNGTKDVIVSLLCVYVLGIFLKLCLGFDILGGVLGEIFKTLGLGFLNKVHNLLLVAIIFSWIGVKTVSLFVWLLILMLVMGHIGKFDDIMPRITSVIFIFSSFAGVIFYLKYEGAVIRNALSESFGAISKMAKNDIKLAQDEVEKIKKSILEEEKLQREKEEKNMSSFKEDKNETKPLQN